ncbi:MAG: hypothetical protein KF819_13135 [Labilithrix sp.]|nr:hypothetical protein [Labilithrix sp.]
MGGRCVIALACALGIGVVGGCTAISGADALSIDACFDPDDCVSALGTEPYPHPRASDRADGGATSRGAPSSTDAPAPKEKADGGATSSVRAIECGDTACSGARPQCCTDGSSFSCVGAGESCARVRMSCHYRSDCGAGELCCLSVFDRTATCRPAAQCQGPGALFVCHDDGECPGTRCAALVAQIKHRVCI